MVRIRNCSAVAPPAAAAHWGSWPAAGLRGWRATAPAPPRPAAAAAAAAVATATFAPAAATALAAGGTGVGSSGGGGGGYGAPLCARRVSDGCLLGSGGSGSSNPTLCRCRALTPLPAPQISCQEGWHERGCASRQQPQRPLAHGKCHGEREISGAPQACRDAPPNGPKRCLFDRAVVSSGVSCRPPLFTVRWYGMVSV